MVQFQKAVKYGALLRLALIGTSGSGKTYSALAIATGLGLPIAFIDTERGSARKYADLFDFDVLELDSFSVDNFIAAINAAERGGYKVLIIDSLSHAWSGKDGILEFVDTETAKSRAKNAYTSGWRAATPKHNQLVDAILGCKMHVIACMRSKAEYVMDEVNGKKVPRKIGLQPVQREGMEYEFDVLGDLDQDHNLIISKSRCAAIDNKLFPRPGAEFAAILNEWLGGSPAPVAAPAANPAPDLEFVPSDSLAKAKADLRKRLASLNAQGLNGYGDWGKVRTDMIAVLGIDHLDKAREEHLDSILVWHDSLGRWMSSTDVPFPASAANPAPAPEFVPEGETIDQPERTNDEFAEIMAATQGIMRKLVDNKIDGFENEVRRHSSIQKHLGCSMIAECTNFHDLYEYHNHLAAILRGESAKPTIKERQAVLIDRMTKLATGEELEEWLPKIQGATRHAALDEAEEWLDENKTSLEGDSK